MDEPQTYFVPWKKPYRRDHILSDFIYRNIQKRKVYEKESRLMVPEREETDGGREGTRINREHSWKIVMWWWKWFKVESWWWIHNLLNLNHLNHLKEGTV